jgi:beta-N-acetylhexosaminidase
MTRGGVPGPVVLDVAGTTLAPDDVERLRHPLVGMVVLFARNFTSGRQLCELTAQIHALRTPALLVAVDHEGGRVQRFREGFTRLPPMALLGRLWDRDPLAGARAALACGLVAGIELRAHGVDLVLAPVLDLDWGRSGVIGDRSLHADPRVVTILAGRVQHGLALAGMANCGKHFPGHGWAHADSHTAVARDERSLRRILAADAAPYRWLGPGLQAVMPAHVAYPRVDRAPAGFSRRWLHDILRGELGFAGAVLSDDLSMHAARAAGDLRAAAHAALEAGCDFVLACNDSAGAGRMLEGLVWVPGPEFAARRRMLESRGPAPEPALLAKDPEYGRAVAIVQDLE